MYEFDETRWETDHRKSSSGSRLAAGWLIERTAVDTESRIDPPPPRYLQIGTGQWCGAEYATLFPMRSAALVYAKEFGYVVGLNVRVVWKRSAHPTSFWESSD